MSERKTIIRTVGLKKHYTVGGNTVRALDGVDMSVLQGEFVCVAGRSGSGKSTIIKLMTGEVVPTAGRVMVNGFSMSRIAEKQIPYMRRTIGVIFQDFRLIPKMTVYDNVAFAMRVIGAKEKDIRKRVPYILQLVGLSQKARSMPNELSGGEQQRVSLARALVNNPKVIIADEPTGNVDPEMSHEIVELLTKINNAGTTVIMVTHEHDLVRSFQRRVIVIKNGEVVSDTPDPTHARFESSEPRKETDMFFYEEGTSIDLSKTADARTDEDVFDNLESLADETPAQAAATPEDENGGAAE